MRELCRKHGITGTFWCKLDPGHTGCCENGIEYSRRPVLGTIEDAITDIAELNAEISRISKIDHKRKTTEWRKSSWGVERLSKAIGERLALIEKLQKVDE